MAQFGYTLLGSAAWNNDCEMAQRLLAAHASVNVTNEVRGYTTLSLLLRVGWKDGDTPLHCATQNDSCGVAQLLLAAKADTNAKDVVTAARASLSWRV